MNNDKETKEFIIEDNIPYKIEREGRKVNTILSNIYNTANKLNVNQSFQIPASAVETKHKNFIGQIRKILNKLILYNKNQNLDVFFTIKTLLNENKEIVGWRVWRLPS